MVIIQETIFDEVSLDPLEQVEEAIIGLPSGEIQALWMKVLKSR
jgi:hypothetical protein